MKALPEKKVVLVALDASPYSLAALETAVKVATCLDAELRAMYVEDIDLFRAAELPFVRIVGTSGQAHPFTPEIIQQQVRRHAEIARDAVTTAGARANIVWSFSVVRGPVTREIADAAFGAEILTVGRSGWSAHSAGNLGSVARTLIETSATSLLMVERNGVREPFAVLYDGSPAAERALALATALDGASNQPLHVFLAASAVEAHEGVAKRLSRSGIQAEFQRLGDVTSGEALESLQRSPARTVLVPATILSKDIQASSTALGKLNRSVFVVR